MTSDASPFHAAELALQERFGRRKVLTAPARRSIRDHLIPQHREFFPQLPFVVVGSIDAAGQPWASIVAGSPGFAYSPDPKHLRVEATPHPQDPLAANLALGAPLALLGIELPTRRRNRLNGTVETHDTRGWSVAVTQSYGNCPQYIQSRYLHWVERAPLPRAVKSNRLSDDDVSLITRADTFFIATSNPHREDGESYGADVSHRGGRPGFVRVDNDSTLTAPDFIGNFFFNTIGNLQVNPRAGLLFPDFVSGDVLLLSTRAGVIWEGDEVQSFSGAQRLLRFTVEGTVRLVGALPFRSDGSVGFAPELARTGIWGTI
ncbi:MAG: pyridoxamine 5'-phosphate oxidase family protein [Proteobacteria bacterium]|nr:pyridoxamine 5'-phosphate oxidase family protein [Pseudomonadota bacterium]